MSQIQNKAVALLKRTEIDFHLQTPENRRVPFLEHALELYFAIGGDRDIAVSLLDVARFKPTLNIDAAVANVMIELAAVSDISDIDMMQATYNRFDAELVRRRR